MLLSMSEVRALEALSIDYPIATPPSGPSMAHAIRQLQVKACKVLTEVADDVLPGVELRPADVVYEPTRVDGALVWHCRWSPANLHAELWGGMKDGLVVALPSLRPVIEFSVLDPGWRGAPRDQPLPKVLCRYLLEGYDTAAGNYVYRVEE